MHLRPLADHARRPDGERLQALRHRRGDQEAQGTQARTSQRRQLPGQNVIQSLLFFRILNWIEGYCIDLFIMVLFLSVDGSILVFCGSTGRMDRIRNIHQLR